MDKFKYKLNEKSEILKPKDVDPALLKRLEAQYGPVDMENDFFSSNLKTYFKADEVNPETGAVSSRIIKLASFAESLQKLYSAFEALKALSITPEGKTDKKVIETLVKTREAFNGFRTYLRKYYPDQYEAIKSQLDEMSATGTGASFTSGTEGENYATPKAFGKTTKKTYGAYSQVGYKKVNEGPGATVGPGPKAGPEGVKDNTYVKNFKYTLVNKKALNKAAKGIEVKQLWEADFNIDDLNITNPQLKEWIQQRIQAFDTLERQLNQLVPLLQQAKKETIKQYSQKPNFGVIYGTDLAEEYLTDIIELFKQPE
jgi:hypothetical protein